MIETLSVNKQASGGSPCQACTLTETFELFLTHEMLDKTVIHTNEEMQHVFDKWNEQNATTNKTFNITCTQDKKAYTGLLLLPFAYW